jgi:hypothetical protein
MLNCVLAIRMIFLKSRISLRLRRVDYARARAVAPCPSRGRWAVILLFVQLNSVQLFRDLNVDFVN